MKYIHTFGLYFILVAVVVWVGMVGVGMYWQYYPYTIEKIYDQSALPILNTNLPLHGGDVVKWRAHYIIYTGGVKSDYTFVIESPEQQSECERREVNKGSSVTVAGEYDHVASNAVIPYGLKPCIYHVCIKTNLYPNPSNRVIPLIACTESFPVE